jgi:hypothetical protein
MNKAITDGLVLMPPPFAAGLDVWSSGNGTPGSDTYAATGLGVFVPADADFGGCLETVKSQSTQRLRFMGETTILPGCYLQVTARVKCLAGAFPTVRIAGFPANSAGAQVGGLPTQGPAVVLDTYGEVVEVSAIIGTGSRTGVDMVWNGAIYGHLGLDITGPNGGLVRIDDIAITDVTGVFLRDMLAQVDVRDYGARGDGVTNDAPAFSAADAAAAGREVLVPKGVYFLNNDVTLTNRVRFEGTVVVPDERRFILQKNFDLATYIEAFGNETQAFRKAFQALLNFSDHESLDLSGRRIGLRGPIDMQACDPSRTTFAIRRVIRNGQFEALDDPAWTDFVTTSQCSYNVSSPKTLSNVVNIANIRVGSLVTGSGVGREVYVREVNVGQARVTLSQELFAAAGTQTFTFRRFKYLLDFSGFDDLSQFVIADCELQCNGRASGIILSPQGLTYHLRDSFITRPKDRGITSHGGGCQGMMIDRCQFLSNEQPETVETRTSIAMNANANDVKIRDNRVVMFRHFAVLAGSGSIISGNHWFQGDEATQGVRRAGVVFTTPNPQSFITANYVDNNFIEWTNEHDATPNFANQFSFGGLTITGNTFLCSDVAPWFSFIVIKPYGSGHFINGFAVVGNSFRTLNGTIDRVERVDTAFADLDYTRMRNVTFAGNVFNNVSVSCANPLSVLHTQSTRSRIWTLDTQQRLPFLGRARVVESVLAEDRLVNASNASVFDAPYVETEIGAGARQFRVVFGSEVSGKVRAMVRMDAPV